MAYKIKLTSAGGRVTYAKKISKTKADIKRRLKKARVIAKAYEKRSGTKWTPTSKKI